MKPNGIVSNRCWAARWPIGSYTWANCWPVSYPPCLPAIWAFSFYLIGLQIQRLEWNAPLVLIVQILILTAVQSLVMVSGAVIVSTQTTSVRAANLLSSFIIIPMALLMQVEAVIMFWGQYDVLWMAILAQIVIARLLIRAGTAHFSREELLGRNVDVLNLRWAWRYLQDGFYRPGAFDR